MPLELIRRHHAARRRRWGHLGMYGLVRIYMPYAWAVALAAGLLAEALR